jgi:tetratricopeptide (TPR) repeat protein
LSLETRKNAIEDPGAELLDRATGMWEQYGRIALYVVVGVLVLGIAGYYWKTGQDRRENSAAEKLAQANELFWRADYDRSRQIAQEISKQYSGTPSGTDALRIAGDNAYWRGNWKEAIADYKGYLKSNNSGLIASTVKRSLAYSLESDGQYPEAITLYTGLVGVFERESSGEMLFAAARCQLALKKPDEAKVLLQRIVNEFPDSSFQLQARIELGRLSPAIIQ